MNSPEGPKQGLILRGPSKPDMEDGHPALLLMEDPKPIYFKPWRGCVKANQLGWDNLPPFARRLQDSQVGELWTWAGEDKVKQHRIGIFWPADFKPNGQPRPDRTNWGDRYATNGPFNSAYVDDHKHRPHLNGGDSAKHIPYIDLQLPPSGTACWKFKQDGPKDSSISKSSPSSDAEFESPSSESCSATGDLLLQTTPEPKPPSPEGSVRTVTVAANIPKGLKLPRKFLTKKKASSASGSNTSHTSPILFQSRKRPRPASGDSTTNIPADDEESELTKLLVRALAESREQDREMAALKISK